MRQLFSFLMFLLVSLPLAAQAQNPPQPEQAQDVPVIDGEAGPCSAEFTVTGPDGAPVFSAQVKVHIAYGFHGLHKLDLSVYTNMQGKTKFKGLPLRVYKPPIEFQASKGQMAGVAAVNPETECQSKHDIVMKNSSH
jgi:hypothetical protein